MEDDLGALRNIFSVLKPGGRAIILVPQDQKAYGTLDEVLGHYRRYSEAQLRARMEKAGFEVETRAALQPGDASRMALQRAGAEAQILQQISIADL